MDNWTDIQIDNWTDDWTDNRMDNLMDNRTNNWTDYRTDNQMEKKKGVNDKKLRLSKRKKKDANEQGCIFL